MDGWIGSLCVCVLEFVIEWMDGWRGRVGDILFYCCCWKERVID